MDKKAENIKNNRFLLKFRQKNEKNAPKSGKTEQVYQHKKAPAQTCRGFI